MRLLVVGALAYVVAATAVFAQERYDRVGPYVGGGFAYGVENIDLGHVERAYGNTISLSVDDSPGFDARGGYRLLPNLAVEADLQFFAFDIDSQQVGYNYTSSKTHVSTLDTLSFMTNVKGYALTGQVQPYGLFGLGLLYASLNPQEHDLQSQDDTVFAVHFGGGVDFYVTPKILINLECVYVQPASDHYFADTAPGNPGVNVSMIPIAVGVQYRF